MATATTKPKKQRKLRGGIGGNPIATPVAAPPVQPTRSQGKQASIDDLVYEHGNNFLEHADADAWLAAVGLQRGDVTPASLKTADKRARERLDSVLNWDPPLVDTWENGQATHHIWHDRSKRYRIARTDNPAQPGFMAAVKVEEKGASEQLIGGDYRSLRAALEAVEAYHLKATHRETVDSNAPETIKAAEESGLASRPRIDAGSPIATISPGTETTQTEENEMATATKNDALYVPEKDARKLLVAMGKAEASTPTKRLTLKLNKIPELMADANEVTGENLALLKRVGAAVQEGVEIVVGDKPAAKPDKVKGKAGAKPSANGASKNGADRDAYGCRVGSQAAIINAAVTDKPKTVDELAKKTGLGNSRIKSHMKWGIDKGCFKQTKEGYVTK